MKKYTPVVIFLLVIFILCCCLLILGGTFYVFSRLQEVLPTLTAYMPFSIPDTSTPTPFIVTRQPVEEIPTDTLTMLKQTEVPINDYIELACRLKGICNLPATLEPPASERQVGEQQQFWVSNWDTLESFQVTAALRYVTPHAYFWVENGLEASDGDVRDITEYFEDKIYPTNRAFFGSEWTPGIDGDVHIYILYTHGLGSNVAGTFSSDDEYNPLIRPYSNGHEMFLINSQVTSVDDSYTYSTLAHEFEHMIEWYQDRNESLWISEGTADLASFLNGFSSGGFDSLFMLKPDMQLNDWPNAPGDPTADFPNYGASFLFVDYFLDRFGETATQVLLHEPLNGLEGVDQTLRDIQATDPQTGQPITADDFFLDWTLTNYLRSGFVGDGRYTYHNYPNAPQASETETISNCPSGQATRTVHQYGTDYIRITCRGEYTLHFAGATSTSLLPVDPHSGSFAFWSNTGESSDMTLTREFDFSGISTPIILTYWTWYDLEENWDYLYLLTSTDNQNWQIVITPSGTAEDPAGTSFGWGYTGRTGGWRQETIDLSQYAGRKLTLRFEYVVDQAVNGEGFLLDDLTIPAINYATDFETDDGGWQAAGFVRVQNSLPQTFRLALIQKGSGGTTVQIIPASGDQTADIPLTIGQNGVDEVILVVTGTTRFTRTEAAYQLEIR